MKPIQSQISLTRYQHEEGVFTLQTLIKLVKTKKKVKFGIGIPNEYCILQHINEV